MRTESPCRTDCPAGDCAGCAFPPPRSRCARETCATQAPRARQVDAPPAPRARCVPCACPQADRCERACMHPWDGVPDIDASVALVDGMCPSFLDTRGAALLARHA